MYPLSFPPSLPLSPLLPNIRLESVHEAPTITILIDIMLPINVFNIGMRGLGSVEDYKKNKRNTLQDTISNYKSLTASHMHIMMLSIICLIAMLGEGIDYISSLLL